MRREAIIREATARLQQMDKHANLNAFVHRLSSTELLDQVKVRSSEVENDNEHSINGKLFAIKANFSVKSWPSDACSKALAGYRSPFDATIVERIKSRGGVISGLTNMDEFGMGSKGDTSIHGPTLNPWGPNLSCGGSSSGSAVAVATGSVFCAIGSDTGGSVRLPASHCGVVGFKPTRGLLSRYGLIAYASSLDVPGIICENVTDVAKVLDIIAGPDGEDSTCILPTNTDRSYTEQVLGAFPSTINVGLCQDFLLPELSSAVTSAWANGAQALSDAGMNIVTDNISLPSLPDSLSAYYVIALAEASSNLARYDGVRYGHRTTSSGLSASEGDSASYSAGSSELHREYARTRTESFGDEVQRRLLMGSLALTMRHTDKKGLSSYYSLASQVREKLHSEFENVFQGVDVLLIPTAPWTPVKRDSTSVTQGYVEDTFTVSASLLGLPAISVPASLCPETNAPIGLQVIGRPGNDGLVMHVARLLEDGLGFVPFTKFNERQP